MRYLLQSLERTGVHIIRMTAGIPSYLIALCGSNFQMMPEISDRFTSMSLDVVSILGVNLTEYSRGVESGVGRELSDEGLYLICSK